MSRKAKVPIALPKGVEVKIDGKTVTVKGPKGALTVEVMKGIDVQVSDNQLTASLLPHAELDSNFLGLFWSLLSNMVKGVVSGFEKKLEMIGVGFRAAVKGDMLDLQIGVSHPVKVAIPKGLEVSIEKNTFITVKGIDKQVVGQFAADIRAKRPPEPYKGKGIRYADEYVRRKAGKSGKK